MRKHNTGTGNRIRAKLSSALGMTLAELLIVVAIVVVLAGLGIVGVWNYQRSLGQLERDSIAKEIFIAAQNHLTMAKGEGYLRLLGDEDSDYGTLGEHSEDKNAEGKSKKVYYIVVTPEKVRTNTIGKGQKAFDLMLPFGSIDEDVRRGGSYLIRYQPETATVLDVFYWTTNDSPDRFNFKDEVTKEVYESFLGIRSDTDKSMRRSYKSSNGPIIGWYGGADPSKLPSITLKAPTIEVNNGDTLTVTVTDNTENSTYTGKYSLKLIITGEESGAQKGVLMLKSTNSGETLYSTTDGRLTGYTFTLDDITKANQDDITKANQHFSQMSSDTKDDDGNEIPFIPGENLKIQAVAYTTEDLANIAYSAEKTANSLYADGTTTNLAYISNIRHLENLDTGISNVNILEKDKVYIKSAKQITDLSWPEFLTKIGEQNISIQNHVFIYDKDGAPATSGENLYFPINPRDTAATQAPYAFSYDGQKHSITGIVASEAKAGMFGSTTQVSEIKNLELIDFSVNGTATAGALAGTLDGCTVTNVLARNSSDTYAVNVSAPIAGGLIGLVTDSTVQYSAAAVIVQGGTAANDTAGGLIGKAGGTVINGCFSGGHTTDGDYEKWVNVTGHSYDVTGTTAGGLVGSLVGSNNIKFSYSTCSVFGTTVGGLVGESASYTETSTSTDPPTSTTIRSVISNCYCTGLVNDGKAFIGSGSPDFGSATSYYYEIINAYEKDDGTIGYREPVDTSVTANVTALDESRDTYNTFVGAPSTWKSAQPYDSELRKYYSGKYNLQTVEQLMEGINWDNTEKKDYFVRTHYGDWPSPELFFVNNA